MHGNSRLKIEEIYGNFILFACTANGNFKCLKQNNEPMLSLPNVFLVGHQVDRKNDNDVKVVFKEKLKKYKQPMLVAYGNGKFSTSVRGHASTPVSRIPKVLSRYATVVMTDEYNTSKVCPDCKQKTLEKYILPFYKRTRWKQLRSEGIGKKRNNKTLDNQKTKTKWTKLRLKSAKTVNRLRPVFELVKDQPCYRILACAQHCSKLWIKHRDHIACTNIAEVCMGELINGYRELVYTRKNLN